MHLSSHRKGCTTCIEVSSEEVVDLCFMALRDTARNMKKYGRMDGENRQVVFGQWILETSEKRSKKTKVGLLLSHFYKKPLLLKIMLAVCKAMAGELIDASH